MERPNDKKNEQKKNNCLYFVGHLTVIQDNLGRGSIKIKKVVKFPLRRGVPTAFPTFKNEFLNMV